MSSDAESALDLKADQILKNIALQSKISAQNSISVDLKAGSK